MVNTRGSRPSIDGKESSEFPTSPSPPVEDNVAPKLSHPLDDDGSVSPRATKKRRIGSEPEDLELPPQPDLADQVPGNKIEEELASALGSGVVDTVEQPVDSHAQIETSTESAVAPEPGAEIDTDMATVISSIMNHAERVEEQCAIGQQQLTDTVDQTAPKGLVFVKANSHLKIQSLPILDNLSTQILSLLAKSTYQDITSFVSEPDSENGQAYATMRSLFDHTKKVYSTKKSFLSATELDLTESSQVDVIRKANLASFVSSIFGTQEIGFSELNENFLDVFVPEGGRLLKVQGALFLELKTQAFIASMNNTERTRTELLYDLFPDDLEQNLLDRRPGTRQLAPSEADFVKRAGSRRDILLTDINNEEAMKALPDKYHWEDFLRDLSSYITKNFDAISHPQAKKTTKGRQPSSSNGDSQDPPSAPLQGQFSVAPQPQDVPVDRNMHGDLVARAARAAQIALQGHGLRRSQQHPTPPGFQQQPGQLTFQQSPLQANFQQYNPAGAVPMPPRPNTTAANHGYMPGIPHYSQSQPTQVLYERARMAASAKSSPSSRKSGLPSQRRPWTTEEENALMAGLDRVKGPHWSQILAMFGPGGTISEALKDRNQVQLKDKARNLKLFFLKSGIEVPYYLKFVTGELKTRAPAQAAKREARERQKKQGEEDKAHVEGIKGMMALAGAHSQQVPMAPNPHDMSASPGLPDAGSHAAFDQTAEQNLMQTLGQEVHGDQFGQPQHHQEHVDPTMHLPQ
ncbi:TTAGGG repeat binding factor [Aspergillus wentii]|nr:TTAGGG repeat binding factor [Aspergillus wentii]